MARPDIILDTNIVIDIILRVPAALNWANSRGKQRIGVTSITIMEVLAGAQNKSQLSKLGRELLEQDSIWAVRQFRAFWLSHRIGINDCLIAAVAARLQLPLYTLNVKDFEPLPDVIVQKPY